MNDEFDLRRKDRFDKSDRANIHSNCLLPVLSDVGLNSLLPLSNVLAYVALLQRRMLCTRRGRFHRRMCRTNASCAAHLGQPLASSSRQHRAASLPIRGWPNGRVFCEIVASPDGAAARSAPGRWWRRSNASRPRTARGVRPTGAPSRPSSEFAGAARLAYVPIVAGPGQWKARLTELRVEGKRSC